MADLVLYYSGAQSNGAVQSSPLLSLGGYRSGTMVPVSNVLSTIFDDLSITELCENLTSNARCIFIKNESGSAITNLSLYIDGLQAENFERIKFGVSQPTTSTDPVQLLNNQNELPYNVTLYEAYTDPTKVTLISSLADGDILALWLVRETDKTTVRDVKTTFTLHFQYT